MVSREGWNLKYNPKTGDFIHTKTHGRAKAGERSTSLDRHGYIRVSKGGKRYLAHRVAFLFMEGEWPPEDVDHINQDRADNRWVNLRKCSRSDNLRNQSKTRGNSIYKGVCWSNGRWISQIKVGEHRYLGSFSDEREAALSYNYQAEKSFGKFASFNLVFEDVRQEVLDGEA